MQILYWCLLLLVCLWIPRTTATTRVPGCRLLIEFTSAGTRLVLLENAANEDKVEIYERTPMLPVVLDDILPSDAYTKLRPSLLEIADFIRQRAPTSSLLEPRYCHMHVFTTGRLRSLGVDHLQEFYNQIYEHALIDADFPFLLKRQDLETIASDTRGFFQILGANYLDGNVEVALTPGNTELLGVLDLEEQYAELVFDIQERWRRTNRRKQISKPLNFSDFYMKQYAGYGSHAFSSLLLETRLQEAANKNETANTEDDEEVVTLTHPCLPAGYERAFQGHQVQGSGDANQCMQWIQTQVDHGNRDCPPGSFCVLQSQPQPKPVSAFFGMGIFRRIVLFTNELLVAKKRPALELPAPTLAMLKIAADEVCSTSSASLASLKLTYRLISGKEEPWNTACFDVCYAIVLLQQFGIEDNQRRVHFVLEDAADQAKALGSGSIDHASTEPQRDTAWLMGAFLYHEAIARQVHFQHETDLLAVQVSEGLPLGWHMSLFVLGAACTFLYCTIIANKSLSHRFHRRITGSSGSSAVSSLRPKTKRRETTFAIMFIEDASE